MSYFTDGFLVICEDLIKKTEKESGINEFQ